MKKKFLILLIFILTALGVGYFYYSSLETSEPETEVIDVKTDSEDFYISKGNSNLLYEDYDSAIENFKKALEYNPNNDKALTGLGEAYQGQKNYEKALENYNKALEISPKSAHIYVLIGKVNYELKNPEEALKYYNKAILLNPDEADAYFHKALIYEDMGDIEQYSINNRRYYELQNK